MLIYNLIIKVDSSPFLLRSSPCLSHSVTWDTISLLASVFHLWPLLFINLICCNQHILHKLKGNLGLVLWKPLLHPIFPQIVSFYLIFVVGIPCFLPKICYTLLSLSLFFFYQKSRLHFRLWGSNVSLRIRLYLPLRFQFYIDLGKNLKCHRILHIYW